MVWFQSLQSRKCEKGFGMSIRWFAVGPLTDIDLASQKHRDTADPLLLA